MKPFRLLLLMSCLLGVAGPTQGEEKTKPPAAPVPTAIDPGKPVPPGNSERADSAFKKLDVGGKGYLTLDDVKVLSNFELIFTASDANGDGRLSPAEFAKAWKAYTAGDKSNQG